jgi:predicted transcriptional regulator YdeE
MGAYQKLHALLPSTKGRKFYGISYADEKGAIIYKAAVEESYGGEAEKFGCDRFTIPKGKYISELLTDWKKDESIVGKTFKKLLAHPKLDKNGFCLEIYLNENDMRCLVGIGS